MQTYRLRAALAASAAALAAHIACPAAVAQEPEAGGADQQYTVARVTRAPEPGAQIITFAPRALDGRIGAIAQVEDDPLRARMFPPELIMEHAAAISLSDDQREAIIRFAEQSQSRATRLHLETRAARAELVAALDESPEDVDAVLALVDRVLEQERQVKLENFGMLLRIRNELTEEQQEQLREEAGPGFGLTATRVIAPFGVAPLATTVLEPEPE